MIAKGERMGARDEAVGSGVNSGESSGWPLTSTETDR